LRPTFAATTDFPKVPDHREASYATLDSAVLREMIERTLFSVCVGSQLLWTLPSQNHSPRFLRSHDPSISADLPSSCPVPRGGDFASWVDKGEMRLVGRR
jgi:hypothetical protein